MDALILSCGTGGGHNAAGNAVTEELRRRGHQAAMFNPYTLHSEHLADRIDNFYIKAVQKAPAAFGAVYSAGQLYRRLPFRSPVYFANYGMVPVMEEYLARNHVDVIISTHLFPAEILTCMKQKGIHIPKTIFIATDYTCIPFTEETDCDAYVIPSEQLKQEFINRGMPGEKLYALGIPVSRRFSQKETRQDACRRQGLDPDKRYILAAGGSMGGGSIKKVIQTLANEAAKRRNTELIVICGSNKKLYDEVKRYNLPAVTVVGFTSDMAGYMKAADLFVTKPGGLSSTEAAVYGIPIVHVAAIPGCETYNARFFSGYGMSRFCNTSNRELADALKILDSETECETMIRNQRKLIRPDAAEQISALAERVVLSSQKAAVMNMGVGTADRGRDLSAVFRGDSSGIQEECGGVGDT